MQAERLEPKWLPTSEAEKNAIQEQLDRLLLDPQFKNSKRYPSFLRFVVTQALQGESESLKERVLGVEVFGRSPDYDSTQDPIVRVTAAEIRKRIVKYYEDPAHHGEIRLLLPSGTYVPVFEFPSSEAEEMGLPQAPAAELPFVPETRVPALHAAASTFPPVPQTSSTAKARWTIFAVALLLVATVAAWGFWRSHQKTPVEAFWAPVMDSTKPVLFCIADQSGYAKSTATPAEGPAPDTAAGSSPTLVAAEDTVPLLDFVSLLRPKTHSFRIQVQGQTNFTDLSQGPTILIGAFDNKWTLFATNPLRFHFQSDPEFKHIWIEDRQNPAKRDWAVDSDHPVDGPRKDYAVVARFLDPNTNQYTVVVAGLGHNGTAAAGNLLLSPQALADLDNAAPKGWKNRNLEVVLETMVVNGHPGVAHIDAIHTW